MGESQSALRLTTYYNAIQPLHNLYQGFVYYDAAGHLRNDTKIPAISVGTEFGAAFPVIAATGDSLFLRRWPVAGTSHVSFEEMDGYVDVETLRDGFLKSPDGKPISLTQATSGCKQNPLWSKVPSRAMPALRRGLGLAAQPALPPKLSCRTLWKDRSHIPVLSGRPTRHPEPQSRGDRSWNRSKG